MARPKKGEESRSQRVSLIMSKTLYADIVTMAAVNGTTINDFIVSLIEPVAKKNRVAIDKFRSAMVDARNAMDFDTGNDTDDNSAGTLFDDNPAQISE